MHRLHIVCGLPASGKTTFAKKLAKQIHAAYFDSDSATDLMIQAAHRAAGLDPHDRDSALYKTTYREPVYETLFQLADDNLAHTDVILAGPFTTELRDKAKWQALLAERFDGCQIEIHHLEIDESLRLERMHARGALRDQAKLS
ncbi:AAA family ATPase [Rubritalea marina]|uniref:AAA family ATPase n=1 Tax=Rubritalea marina TaxID=361055 RepID=UPI00035EE2AF|nr:AAA family ATPase [Rubritalea marina]